MALTVTRGRPVPDAFDFERVIADAYSEISRLREQDSQLIKQLSRSRKLIEETRELLSRLRSIER